MRSAKRTSAKTPVYENDSTYLSTTHALQNLSEDCDNAMECIDSLFAHEGTEAADKISPSLELTRGRVAAVLADCDDLKFHKVEVGGINGRPEVLVLFLETMVDRNAVERAIIHPLETASNAPTQSQTTPQAVTNFDAVRQRLLIYETKSVFTVSDIVDGLLFGYTAVLIDGSIGAVMCDTMGVKERSISESAVEASIVGPHNAFIEHLQTNLGLIRTRLRDSRLKVEIAVVGRRSRTKVALIYMEDIARADIVNDLAQRIRNITLDSIQNTSNLWELLDGKRFAFFPTARRTERPDTVIPNLLEGRVAIMADGSPNAFVVPAVLADFIMAADDHYLPALTTLLLRFVRMLGIFIVVFLPGLYVAAAAFNSDILPIDFAQSIAQSRTGVPMTVFLEVVFMEAMMELLQEASIRLPQKIGAVATVFGGLILGQAAANARIISNVMVIIVAMTAISSFAIPQYETSLAWRIIKWIVVIGGALFGLYGVVILAFVILIYLNSLSSLGTPYLAPFAPLVWHDIRQDIAVRTPLWSQVRRYRSLAPRDVQRQHKGLGEKKP